MTEMEQAQGRNRILMTVEGRPVALAEGFDELDHVRIEGSGGFVVEEWQDEEE